jgi:hypothetical protein
VNELLILKQEKYSHHSYFWTKSKKFLVFQNHFFIGHKILIRRKLSNDEFLITAAIDSNAQVQEIQNKFLPTDASFRILGSYKEVVSINDSAVGSGQPTEKKTKNLGNIQLDIETDLRDFEEKNSSRRISKGSGATSLGQQQGSLARKNVNFVGYFTEKEKQLLRDKINANQFDEEIFLYKPINFDMKNSNNSQKVQNFKISRRMKLNGACLKK